MGGGWVGVGGVGLLQTRNVTHANMQTFSDVRVLRGGGNVDTSQGLDIRMGQMGSRWLWPWHCYWCQTGWSISETADVLECSIDNSVRVYTEWCTKQNCLVEEKVQRRISRLVQVYWKTTITHAMNLGKHGEKKRTSNCTQFNTRV